MNHLPLFLHVAIKKNASYNPCEMGWAAGSVLCCVSKEDVGCG